MKKNKYKEYQLNNDQTISFVDSKGYKQRLVINHMLYKQLHNFELQDKKEMNEYDRHIEHLEQTEITLYKRTKNRYISLEDIVLTKIINEKLHDEIDKLPYKQKRRLKMYYFDDMTLKEIGYLEKCSPQAVSYSIECAIKNLAKILNN